MECHGSRAARLHWGHNSSDGEPFRLGSCGLHVQRRRGLCDGGGWRPQPALNVDFVLMV